MIYCQLWMLIIDTVSTCFGRLYAHLQEKRPRVTAYGVYLLVVLDVAGCGTVVLRWGCDQCEGCCLLSIVNVDYWHCLNMFRASLCPSSGEKTTCYCIWSVFAGSVGCGRLRYCGATLRVWSLWRLLPIVNCGCWLLTLSQHVSDIFMPIFRRKDHVLLHMECICW